VTDAVRVIVVAERPVADLLASSGARWDVQDRQPTMSAMWESLGKGDLDPQSRVLVFSDSLLAGSPSEADEAAQTAAAVVAMAHAGAHVFVAIWRPDDSAAFRELVVEAAAAQGVDVTALRYHLLPIQQGGLAVLESMKRVLGDEVDFPESFPEAATGPIAREAYAPALPLSAPSVPRRPDLPPIGGAIPARPPVVPRASDLPAAASAELLGRPKVPGQVTITVTSSKGGSGKSTVSILLAGSIARSSADAGSPLSVCLVDLDTRDGQVASLIGKFMPTALNIRVQPVWDEERIRRNLLHASGLGIDTLLAPIRPRTADTVGPDFYRAIVRSLQRMYDVVILDTSVQYLDPLIAQVALPEAEEILFTTTLASTAVQGMARALREITAPVDESGLGIPREKIGIVVNQSVANVGMERDQVLAAGLGVPVVGVIPLATKDVLTATNLNRMHALLDHPLLGPAYIDLARSCLPGRPLADWRGLPSQPEPVAAASVEDSRRRGLFRR
jgi:cellulose biosynthesis protein BcsQ